MRNNVDLLASVVLTRRTLSTHKRAISRAIVIVGQWTSSSCSRGALCLNGGDIYEPSNNLFYLIGLLEMRSMKRGICLIETSIMKITVPIIMAGCIVLARNGRISTTGETADVTIVFLDPDFSEDAKISAIRP